MHCTAVSEQEGSWFESQFSWEGACMFSPMLVLLFSMYSSPDSPKDSLSKSLYVGLALRWSNYIWFKEASLLMNINKMQSLNILYVQKKFQLMLWWGCALLLSRKANYTNSNYQLLEQDSYMKVCCSTKWTKATENSYMRISSSHISLIQWVWIKLTSWIT